LLAPARSDALADALLSIVADRSYRERLAHSALAAVRGRTWEASLDRLAAGYRLALDKRAGSRARSVA
jgi:glycosyltransferase involved in cell wall biosynthesis